MNKPAQHLIAEVPRKGASVAGTRSGDAPHTPVEALRRSLFPCSTKDNSTRNSELILTVAIQVAKLGVVIVHMSGAYPDVFRHS